MSQPSKIVGLLRGSVGGILGGVLGYYGFIWLGRHGFYAIILPGSLIGLGFGVCSGRRSPAGGIACGLFAVALGIYTEWRWHPFAADQSLAFFLSHFHQLSPVKIVLILLAGAFSFWLGSGPGREAEDDAQARASWQRIEEMARREKAARRDESDATDSPDAPDAEP